MIVGITGYAQSGKDTVGQYFVDEWGFREYKFAGPLKAAMYTLNPIVGINKVDSTWIRYQDLFIGVGIERAKKVSEVRRLLQTMGTEVGRKMFGEDFWVRQTFEKIEQDMLEEGFEDVVITDLRFQNEAKACDLVFRVHRPGVGPVNDHASEDLNFKVDAVIQNRGTIEELYQQLDHPNAILGQT
jgi:hypothetical protein